MGESSLGDLLDPNLNRCKDGDRVSLQAVIHFRCPGATVCSSRTSGTMFMTDIALPSKSQIISIMDAVVTHLNGKIWIQADQHTRWFHPNRQDVNAFDNIIEACAGIGIACKGYEATGSSVCATIEKNPRYAEYLRQHGNTNVIEGDVSSLRTIADTFAIIKADGVESHTVSAGMACQPFSKLGDQRQEHDTRSQSMTGALALSFFTGATAVILECTGEAYTSEWVLQMNLQTFCRITKYNMEQGILKLDDTWSAKRTRWWCVLRHPAIINTSIPDMPAMQFQPTVMHVLPHMMNMTPEAVQMLTLDDQEVDMFQRFPPGIAKEIINKTQPLPTATHSWGSQATRCDCGCRQAGFNPARLQQKGIHGVLVPMHSPPEADSSSDHIPVRHLHPIEVAVLNGVPPNEIHVEDHRYLRMVLSGVGQMGSPLQSCWVLANIKYQLGHQFPQLHAEHPRFLLANLCKEVLRQRDSMWKQEANRFMSIFHQEVNALDRPFIFEHPDNIRGVAAEPGESQASIGESPASDHSLTVTLNQTPSSLPAMQHQQTHPASDHSLTITFADQLTHRMQMTGHSHTSDAKADHSLTITPQQAKGKGVGSNKRKTPETDTPSTPDTDELVREAINRIDPVKTTCGGVAGFEASHVEPPKAESPPLHEHRCSPNESEMKTEAAEGPVVHVDTRPVQEVRADPGPDSHEHPALPATMRVGSILVPSQAVQPGQIILVETANNPASPKTQHRHQYLWQQKGQVAQDEMQFYMQQMHTMSSAIEATPVIIGHESEVPLQVGNWIGHHIQASLQRQEPYHAGTIMWYEGHWFPIAITMSTSGMMIKAPSDMSKVLHRWFSLILGADMFTMESMPLQTIFPMDCGFQAIAWLKSTFGLDSRSCMTPVQAEQLRQMFARHVETNPAQYSMQNMGVFGGAQPDKVKQALQQLLEQHAVHPRRSAECAANLIQHIGISNIQQALGAARPWADLKSRASQLKPPIQIVLSHELQDRIAQRAKEGKQIGHKRNKKSQRMHSDAVQIVASEVQIPFQVFQQEDGQALHHQQPHQFHGTCSGIAVVNVDEALPFFALNAPLTTNGLGLIVLDHQDPRVPTPHEIIRFPATCKSTGEPMLLTGALLQLGAKRVQRFVPTQVAQIQETSMTVLRVQVYRDQTVIPWDEISQRPVKTILGQPEFSQCRPEDIVDVWDRQFLNRKFQKTKAPDSDVFVFSVRITTDKINRILEANALDGKYYEPRSENGRKPHECFGVDQVVKPSGNVEASKRTLQHVTQTQDGATDPWLKDDPWGKPTQKSLSAHQLAALEANIHRKVVDSIASQTRASSQSSPDEDADMTGAQDKRVTDLEFQVKQMQDNMQQLAHTVQTNHQEQQQQNSAISGQMLAVRNQMETQQSSIQQMLNQSMEEQLKKIDALISKRAKMQHE
eukprot:Skav217260  [mRNA]  locus=scaffold47:1180518:1185328:+ [translate_table: standard]